MPLTGRTALVTGAGKGFGKAIAETLLKNGANVVLHYRTSEAGVRAAAETAPGRAFPLQADLARAEAAGELVASSMAQLGSIDILVNNAGSMKVGPFVDSTEESWRADIELNIWAPLRITRAVVPHMIEKGHGKIVNISSQLATGGWDRGSVYAGTKGFLLTWTKSLAAELGQHGINVNAVGPGSIVTDLNRDIYPDEAAEARVAASLPLRRLGRPADVAESVLFLASPASDFMTGQMLVPNGGSRM